MNHLINTMQVNLQCATEDAALHARYLFANNMQQKLFSALDETFTTQVSDDTIITIDTLEIDMEHISETDFNNHFVEIILKQVEKKLTEKIGQANISSANNFINSTENTLQYFLLNGVLPWYADKNNFNINEQILDYFSKAPDVAKAFFLNNKTNTNFWIRTSKQINIKTAETLISYFPELIVAKNSFETLMWNQAKTESDKGFQQNEIAKELLIKAIISDAPNYFVNQLSDEFILSSLQNKISLLEKKHEVLESIKMGLNPQIGTIETGKIENAIDVNDLQIKDETIPNPSEKYFIGQAGIVVMAPFLKPFFAKLGLWENNNWTNENAQSKAVHLVKHISTGNENFDEHDLIFEKVICGMPIPFPIQKMSEFTEEEKAETQELINSVIEHWDALKRTSTQAFRQTFLQREGVLQLQNNDWKLKVERKTLDILLDKLPWSFSTIALPWNKNLILVDW